MLVWLHICNIKNIGHEVNLTTVTVCKKSTKSRSMVVSMAYNNIKTYIQI